MNKNHAVSVIVTLSDAKPHIKACVDSILSQTFTDFEVIVADDASRDKSYELCQKLYGDNDRIKLLRHKDKRGLEKNRNDALKHARGKYVYLVDSDESLSPDALEKFYAAAEIWQAGTQKSLRPFCNQDEPFARFLFNEYNTFRRQAQIATQQKTKLATETLALFNRLELAANKIVFVNFLGRGFGCNPKYIALEILRQKLSVDMVWLVSDMQETMPAGIRKVRYGSVESVYELATAKVIVTNVKNRLPFPDKKQGQFFIMTWHGGEGFKLIEKDAEKNLSAAYVRETKKNSELTDLMMVET